MPPNFDPILIKLTMPADAIATLNLADLREGAARFGIPAERPGAVLRRMRG